MTCSNSLYAGSAGRTGLELAGSEPKNDERSKQKSSIPEVSMKILGIVNTEKKRDTASDSLRQKKPSKDPLSLVTFLQKQTPSNDLRGVNVQEAVAHVFSQLEEASRQTNHNQLCLLKFGRQTVAVQSEDESFSAFVPKSVLGKGSCATAIAMHEIIGDDLLSESPKRVLKITRLEESDYPAYAQNVEKLENESNILNKIYEAWPDFKGIQRPHIAFLKNIPFKGQFSTGHFTRKHTPLDHPDFKKRSFDEKKESVKELMETVKRLHAINIFHGDIKPNNSGIDKNGTKLTGFGGARDADNVNPLNPLGIHTFFYTHDEDQKMSGMIQSRYILHKCAVQSDYSRRLIADCLKDCLPEFLNGISQKTAEDAREYIKSINLHYKANEAVEEMSALIQECEKELKSLNEELRRFNARAALDEETEIPGSVAEKTERLKEIVNKIEHMNEELDRLDEKVQVQRIEADHQSRVNHRIREKLFGEGSEFKMCGEQLAELKKQAQDLCRRHDAYAMAVTALEILSGRGLGEQCFDGMNTDQILTEMLSSLAQKDEQLADRFHNVLTAKPKERATIEMVMDRLKLEGFMDSSTSSSSSAEG